MSGDEVTIIIPVMVDSDERYIERTIISVGNQTIKSNIIIVANEQLDWIDALLEKYIHLNPLIIKSPLCYLGKARNIGVEHANTKYVAFVDADDLWHKDKIKIQLDFMRKNKFDICGCDHVMIDENDTKFAFGMSKNIPMPSSWFIKTEVLKKTKFNNEIKVCEDGDWWLRVIHKYQIARLDKTLLLYRVKGSSLSSGSKSKSKSKKEMLMRLTSRFSVVRFLILCITYIPYILNRRNHYIPHNDWKMGDK